LEGRLSERGNVGVRVIDVAGKENELEGYDEVSDRLGIFVTSSSGVNVTFATTRVPRVE
jgi:hypothetical protein